MALHELKLSFKPAGKYTVLKQKWFHSGVVGSGDMEVLMEKKRQNGQVNVKIVTPVVGFDEVWKKVLERFVTEYAVGDLNLEINDNNATPFIVSMRLKQALLEAREAEKGGGQNE